jgi:hypothetical protein
MHQEGNEGPLCFPRDRSLRREQLEKSSFFLQPCVHQGMLWPGSPSLLSGVAFPASVPTPAELPPGRGGIWVIPGWCQACRREVGVPVFVHSSFLEGHTANEGAEEM